MGCVVIFCQVKLYDTKAIAKQKIKVFARTNMIELVADEIKLVGEDSDIKNDPALSKANLDARTNAIFDKIDHEPESVKACEEFFSNDDLIAELRAGANFTSEYIGANHGITVPMLEDYYKFSKFKYDCGMYVDAEIMLSKYLSIQQVQTPSVLGALWGRLACSVLQAKWDESYSHLLAVKDAIDSRSLTAPEQLKQRAWLMHWGLLVFLNQRNGADALFDFFSEKSHLQAIENQCPWLLRYYAAAAIMSSKRRVIIRDALAEIQSMSYLHSDPMTQLIESLYDRFDFAEAQSLLVQCTAMIQVDFFLQTFADKFLHEARIVICEVYCGINRRVDIVTLAEVLQLSEEEAEKWMVEMIRGAAVATASGETVNASSTPAINARIDSDGKQVIMAPPVKSIHQSVVEKTRDLPARSGILTTHLESLVKEQGNYMRELDLVRSSFA